MAKRRTSTSAASAPISAVRHKDTRKNIPTEELRDFVADDESAPKKVLYPRNPDLDPQLVWKGKDQQDSKPLEVPIVPVYIQEKIIRKPPPKISATVRESVGGAALFVVISISAIAVLAEALARMATSPAAPQSNQAEEHQCPSAQP